MRDLGKAAAVRKARDVPYWHREADVVIVGFGAAGACAAIEAAEAGREVLLLERASGGGGTSALSTGQLYLGGGTPIQGEQRITRLVSGNYAWDLNPQGNPVPQPAQAELRQLEIWLTPHGFIKGALASNPTAVTRNEYGQRVTVVSFKALGKYRVNGTINAQGLVQRTQTWIPRWRMRYD